MKTKLGNGGHLYGKVILGTTKKKRGIKNKVGALREYKNRK